MHPTNELSLLQREVGHAGKQGQDHTEDLRENENNGPGWAEEPLPRLLNDGKQIVQT